MRLTMKFGGTSVGTGPRIAAVAGLVREAVKAGKSVAGASVRSATARKAAPRSRKAAS